MWTLLFFFMQWQTGFSFKQNGVHTIPKIEDFVWFEEPEIFIDKAKTGKILHKDHPSATASNLFDFVWFDMQKLENSKQNEKPNQNMKSNDSDTSVNENPIGIEDEVFSKYFFVIDLSK